MPCMSSLLLWRVALVALTTGFLVSDLLALLESSPKVVVGSAVLLVVLLLRRRCFFPRTHTVTISSLVLVGSKSQTCVGAFFARP